MFPSRRIRTLQEKPAVGRRALTLLETMLALGILLSGLVGIFALLQAGLMHSRRSQQELELSLLARRLLDERLEQLRDASAYQALSPGLGSWTQAEGGVEVRWRVLAHNLYSPGSALEGAFPLGDQRVLPGSVKRLELELRTGASRLRWWASVPEPLRTWSISQPLVLTLTTGVVPVPKDGELEFRVRCQGNEGRDLEGVMVSWSVIPVTGVGTLVRVARDGSWATFKNVTRRKNGSPRHSGGVCYVEAQARYAGELRSVRSAPIGLIGP